jgi:hypothetical protein
MSSCATWHADISCRFAAGEHSGVMGNTASTSAIPQPIPQTIPQLNTNDFIPDPTAGFSDDIPPFSEMNIPYPGAAKVFYPGRNFMDEFDSDEYSQERMQNLYYPFSSKEEWQLAYFLLRSRLSMAHLDEFLALPIVRGTSIQYLIL